METSFLALPFLAADDPMAEILHHNVDVPFGPLGITKFTVNMWVGAAILLVLVLLAKKDSLVPKGILRGIFESLYFFIRDELVYPVMGEHHGRKFVPFFMTLFSYILTLNLVGLLPLPVIGGAATSQISMTGTLAIIVLAVSIGAGIVYNGPIGFLRGFMPPGVPWWVLPLIFVLELGGFFIRHAVLAVRLMANMLGGHLVVGAFLGLIFIYKTWGSAVAAVPMALFINLLEVLVALLQAYVFTLLSVLFIGGTVHPEH